jgi:hypothetical protein
MFVGMCYILMWYSGDVDRLFGIFLYQYIKKLQYPYTRILIHVERSLTIMYTAEHWNFLFGGIIMECKVIFS